MTALGAVAHRWVAGQLAHPDGAFGRYVLAPLWNRRNAALNDAAWDALALGAGARVLEVGFGGGALLRRMAEMPGVHVSGLDVSMTMVERATHRCADVIAAGRVTLARGVAEALPFADAQFSHVVSVNSLFYWADVRAGLREGCRVLDAGGRLVVCFTRAPSLQGKGFAAHLRLFDEEDVQTVLRSCPVEVLAAERRTDRHRDFVCLTARKTLSRAPGCRG